MSEHVVGMLPRMDEYERCPVCLGIEAESGDCEVCDGSGFHECRDFECGAEHDCGACDGTGQNADAPANCERCGGTSNIAGRCFTLDGFERERIRKRAGIELRFVQDVYGCGGRGFVIEAGRLLDCPRCVRTVQAIA